MKSHARKLWDLYFHGILLAVLVALAARFIGEHYAVPSMLFALLAGMALSQIYNQPPLKSGIDLSSSFFLRLGVGLMGAGLSFNQLSSLGLLPVLGALGVTGLALLIGLLLARLFGRTSAFGILAAGSVAICGAAAALAISTILPKSGKLERNTLFVVVTVTALSTVAMIVYPILFKVLGFDDEQLGFLIGATIHDVAQVVGAGYSVSDEAGLTATFIKMLRVALLPVVVFFAALTLSVGNGQKMHLPGLPWFLIMFIFFAVLGVLNWIPAFAKELILSIGKMLLLIAIAAIGMKVDLKEMLDVHPNSFLLVLSNTLIIAALAVGFLMLFWIPVST